MTFEKALLGVFTQCGGKIKNPKGIATVDEIRMAALAWNVVSFALANETNKELDDIVSIGSNGSIVSYPVLSAHKSDSTSPSKTRPEKGKEQARGVDVEEKQKKSKTVKG